MSANTSEPHELDGERGLPSVNETRPISAKRGLIVISVALVILGVIGLVYISRTKSRGVEQAPAKDMQVTNAVPARSFEFPAPPPPPPPPAAAVPVVPAPAGGRPMPPGGRVMAERPAADLDKSASGLMANKGGGAGAGGLTGAQRAVSIPGPEGGGALGGLLVGTKTRTNSATMLPDRNFLLAKGAFIDCALQTRLDSTVPGMTACTITRDIYSDNGKVLLLEAGSKVTGEYRANMKQGQARIFVLWTRITTPNGVAVNLDSPGSDALGGSGVPGYVDTHFWTRFGGAIMLSLVDDIARYASTRSSKNETIYPGNTSDSAQDMAAEALKNTINIPPTLYVNQGDRVGIYVARDLDFGGVYALNAE
ncbi:MAG: type IV secretion system protein VirB10 [Candidatus Cloacimonetes bacterium]|nr:type IV secretion system protein VirB10 [Candidatus Cloacimonadota bacterium]